MDKFLINAAAKAPPKEKSTVADTGSKLTSRKRNYQDDFLKFGFTSITEKQVEKPKCLVCDSVLSAESMKRNKLERHLKSNHPGLAGKPLSHFQEMLKQYKKQTGQFKAAAGTQARALRASFEVSYLIAQCKKPHTIGESLILPAAIAMVKHVIGEAEAAKLSAVPLSNKTVKRRIDLIAEDQEQTIIDRLRNTEAFALQADSSTEGQYAYLLVFVRYIWHDTIEEEFLFCHSMHGRETGADIFQEICHFIEGNNIPWDKLKGFCSDGAPAMAGKKRGLQKLLREKAPHCLWSHCLIHREQLASKSLSAELSSVLDKIVALVNFVKTSSLRARLFTSLCQEFNSEHVVLLYHTEVRWLSRGNVLHRVFELRHELQCFLSEQKAQNHLDFLSDKHNQLLLAYLCDIFAKLNDLNISLQGKQKNVLTLHDKLSAFVAKLQYWQSCIENNNFKPFPTFNSLLELDYSVGACHAIISSHLQSLQSAFTGLFP